MKYLFPLFLLACIAACETDSDDYCHETLFSDRHELDTMFFGTWEWHYSVKKCWFQSSLIAIDTIWPNEFIPEIGRAYPQRLISIGEELRVVTDVDTQLFCMTEWLSNGQTNSSYADVTGYVVYRKLFEPDNRDYFVLSYHSALMETNICNISPSMYSLDFCPSTDWDYASTTADYYMKVH
jgi:hypothetical protein